MRPGPDTRPPLVADTVFERTGAWSVPPPRSELDRLAQLATQLANTGAALLVDASRSPPEVLASHGLSPQEVSGAIEACGHALEHPLVETWMPEPPAGAGPFRYGHWLPLPVLALRGAPAQFVFDRGQLDDDPAHQGVLAFVISASNGERDDLQSAVLAQAHNELGLASLQPLQTVVERRATFACLPALHRPPAAIAPGLWAAGDHVAGPYPATLEGAVRSGLAAAARALA